MRKLSTRWVPRLLTADHKRARIVASEQCLGMYQRNSKEFLRCYVTLDKTRIHYYTSETKNQSKMWTGPGESTPQKGEYYASLLDRFDAILKEKRSHLAKKNAFPPEQCTNSHECHCNGQIISFTLRNTSSSTLFPRFDSFRIFFVS